MSLRLKSVAAILLSFWILSIWNGCSSPSVTPTPTLIPPVYLQVPHPEGPDSIDLEAIFRDPKAPKPEELKICDDDFKKLRLATASEDEFKRGVLELVQTDPVKLHWCFYHKLLEHSQFLKSSVFIDEKQKRTLEVYAFLAPVARAFMTQYRDSRYMRQAIRSYRRTSEWVFFRKLELSPQGTSELVEVSQPFGLVRPSIETDSVLGKYNIRPPEPIAALTAPTGVIGATGQTGVAATAPSPTAAPTPVPTPTPSLIPAPTSTPSPAPSPSASP